MKRHWNIDLVPIFAAIVEQKGITSAANYLGMPKSSVSKSLSRLEESLGVRLLKRNSRNQMLTSEGEVFYRQSLNILEQVEAANSVMSGLTAHPRGRLVVALPIAFTREIVAPRLGEFIAAYPEIQLEILVGSSTVDIVRDQIDLAVVVGDLENSELIIRNLYRSRLTCVTSPAYAHDNNLQTAEARLQDHVKICETRYALSRFPIRVNGQKKLIDLESGIIHVNDPITVRESVLNGCGVAILPILYCRKQLQTGELVTVFDSVEFNLSAAVLSIIHPSRRLMSNKTRAFQDFLINVCGDIPD